MKTTKLLNIGKKYFSRYIKIYFFQIYIHTRNNHFISKLKYFPLSFKYWVNSTLFFVNNTISHQKSNFIFRQKNYFSKKMYLTFLLIHSIVSLVVYLTALKNAYLINNNTRKKWFMVKLSYTHSHRQ